MLFCVIINDENSIKNKNVLRDNGWELGFKENYLIIFKYM